MYFILVGSCIGILRTSIPMSVACMREGGTEKRGMI